MAKPDRTKPEPFTEGGEVPFLIHQLTHHGRQDAMLTGLQGTDRKPTYALMVTDRNDPRGTALWSDPDREKVVEEAKQLNARLVERKKAPRYRVEERFPVDLGMVFSGDGSAYNKNSEMHEKRRNNGC